ncbi:MULTISPECIES: aspartate kinase [Fictibacillus]|uniref:Aspartokinase n=1 Tax=Fictibacillus enclensis TaxID=1017270 RepID=A0A0V8J9R4_9BACL|nr:MULTISPECIES: aspartate kinase [Fictibacillus]KSU83723.1 aspartate kinase [Fictibacillus enclensis]RXY98236.1 aspartate kinase [Fictibacillus sp. S7]WHY70768.1 aspartate kinase [Fictibacillus enclensis]SCC20149.1 aspartate kinase [Fictibacillus enclensis]
MALIVQKFGGTSVGTPEKIRNAARRIIQAANEGNQVIAVVSAMGKTTDDLVKLAGEITSKPSKREMDMLLTTGEQITISLLAMALEEAGHPAESLTGWQAGIQTESLHGNARILDIDTKRIETLLNEGKIAVVAGFQGWTASQRITTLGRGGSDTTAVAIAAALRADKCEIYTDVTGVFTTDPRVVKHARKLAAISYDEMLELANLGAGVLHPRAVEFAKNYGVKLEVRSSMEEERGTIVEEEAEMENNLVVRGLAFEGNVTKITIENLPNGLNTLSSVFSLLADNNINVDIIIQSVNKQEKTNISFSIDSAIFDETVQLLEQNKGQLGFSQILHEDGLAKVSIVGSGMISNPGVAAQMFKALSDQNIMIKMVSTSEIKVSTVVGQQDMINAIETLHDVFELDARVPVQHA